jgi:hypothetical protein
MATAKTKIDALGIYHTGGSVAGATQVDPDLSLGGERACNEMTRMGALVSNAIPPVVIKLATGSNGAGTAAVNGTSASGLKFTAPSGTLGSESTVSDGSEILLEDGGDVDKAIRIERDGATDLNIGPEMGLALEYAFNTPLGLDNVTSAERAAGHDSYRGVMLRNHSDAAITSIAVWVGTLGTQRTTDGGQLGASGSGTITTTGSLADWPEYGWAHILTSGAATREIVYYTSRTATALTVPSGGRGLLGTSAGAGASDDTIDAVPGIRVGLESPSSGAIQTIANDTTAPSGITWDTGITSATGLTLASLAADTNHGLWVHREIPAVAVGTARAVNKIHIQFIYSAVTYDDVISSYYRVADTSLDSYELYEGIDTSPTLTATPDTTSTGLPFTYTVTPTTGTSEFNYVVRKRNNYNLLSLNVFERTVRVGSSGEDAGVLPSPPEEVALIDVGGGNIRVTARYVPDADTVDADTWNIYGEGDGSTPVPGTDTPIISPTMGPADFPGLSPALSLEQDIGPYAEGTVLNVIVTTERSTDNSESSNTAATSITVGSAGPSKPIPAEGFLAQ